MNEIKNYTMNFGYGRLQRGLNLLCKLAFAEIQCDLRELAGAFDPARSL